MAIKQPRLTPLAVTGAADAILDDAQLNSIANGPVRYAEDIIAIAGGAVQSYKDGFARGDAEETHKRIEEKGADILSQGVQEKEDAGLKDLDDKVGRIKAHIEQNPEASTTEFEIMVANEWKSFLSRNPNARAQERGVAILSQLQGTSVLPTQFATQQEYLKAQQDQAIDLKAQYKVNGDKIGLPSTLFLDDFPSYMRLYDKSIQKINDYETHKAWAGEIGDDQFAANISAIEKESMKKGTPVFIDRYRGMVSSAIREFTNGKYDLETISKAKNDPDIDLEMLQNSLRGNVVTFNNFIKDDLRSVKHYTEERADKMLGPFNLYVNSFIDDFDTINAAARDTARMSLMESEIKLRNDGAILKLGVEIDMISGLNASVVSDSLSDNVGGRLQEAYVELTGVLGGSNERTADNIEHRIKDPATQQAMREGVILPPWAYSNPMRVVLANAGIEDAATQNTILIATADQLRQMVLSDDFQDSQEKKVFFVSAMQKYAKDYLEGVTYGQLDAEEVADAWLDLIADPDVGPIIGGLADELFAETGIDIGRFALFEVAQIVEEGVMEEEIGKVVNFTNYLGSQRPSNPTPPGFEQADQVNRGFVDHTTGTVQGSTPAPGFSTRSETPINPVLLYAGAPSPNEGKPMTEWAAPISRAIMLSHNERTIEFTLMSPELAGLQDYSEDTQRDLEFIVKHLNDTIAARLTRAAIAFSVGQRQPLSQSLNTIAIEGNRVINTQNSAPQDKEKFTLSGEGSK
jgi:gas vesicle protein